MKTESKCMIDDCRSHTVHLDSDSNRRQLILVSQLISDCVHNKNSQNKQMTCRSTLTPCLNMKLFN